MKILLLLSEGIKRAPGRFALTLASITLCFVLFGLLYNIKAGFDYTLEWLSNDSLRVMSRVSLREPLPFSYLAKIEAVPGISGVEYAAVFGGYFQDPKKSVSAAAIGADRLLLFPHLRIDPKQQQAMKEIRTAAVAGRALAQKYGWSIGDKVPVVASNLTNQAGGTTWTFDLVGIWDMEGNPDLANEIYVNYDYINEARATDRNTVNIFIVRTTSPEATKSVARSIDAMFANSPADTWTRSDREWVGSAIRRVGDVHLMVNLVLGTALFTLFVLTRNAIAQSVRERIQDFGVLKVLGFTDWSVAMLIAAEALILCIVGAVLGLFLSRLFGHWFASQMRMTILTIPPGVFSTGLLFAVGLAFAACLPSAFMIMRMTPAHAVAKR
jgi:putative ABC transport system permease protein